MAAAIIFASCTKDLHENQAGNDPLDPVASKLIFTSSNAVKGELLVYFEDEASAGVQAVTKSGTATRSGIAPVDEVLENIGVKSLRRLFPYDARNEERTVAAGLHRWYMVEFDESVDLDKAAMDLAGIAEVSRVEFNQKLRHISEGNVVPFVQSKAQGGASNFPAFNDPMLNDQWHYINTGNRSIYVNIKAGADVNCKDAWALCTGDPRIIVAVVDNCVQWDHPDLAANMWVNTAEKNGSENSDDDGNGYKDDIHGFNFVDNKKLTISVSGDAPEHGTHVAGTVAAVNNNGVGVCGVAGGSGNGDGVRIMSCQIFRDNLGGTAAISAAAIKYAADNGASIIQCSYGYTAGLYTSDDRYLRAASAEKQAIDYFIGKKNNDAVDGGIVVFAAGNETAAMAGYPGAYKDYIAVTAMSCDFTPAYYTNYGPGCNIAAPGGDMIQAEEAGVLSTINNGGYGYLQGTSMACPHVSGVAALGLSYALKLGKTFTRDQFNSIILSSVNGIDEYCTGSKLAVTAAGTPYNLQLLNFRGKMGTGYIDAFQVLMNLRGVTCISVAVGQQQTIDVKDYIGDGVSTVKIAGVDISADDMARLGMSSKPTVFGSKIIMECTNAGSAIVTFSLVAGTDSGSGMSGMAFDKEFAIVARSSHAGNGGWL